LHVDCIVTVASEASRKNLIKSEKIGRFKNIGIFKPSFLFK